MKFEITTSAIVMSSFTVLALLTLLLRKPFSLWFAYRRTPEELWTTPLFFQVNMMLTGTWTVLFALCAVVCGYGPWWTPIGTTLFLFLLARQSDRIGHFYAARLRPTVPAPAPPPEVGGDTP